MESLPLIITDLAYILIVAGVVTIIFKRLHQPLVLGYIVAGFLAGPNMPYTPSITDDSSIEQWSNIGVIFLMFTLGLEFSFKRIVRMGIQPIIATLCVMFSMLSIGSAAGYIFGWNGMDRLFLGGMLAMSSTTIIYKAFDDLGLRSKPFASGVLSTLILEDILGILLMVILSAVAVSKRLEGIQLFHSFMELGFFLLICFLVGIFLVPLFFRRYKKYINAETLLIISVGLCFLLVVVAARVGYSPAFGAFMMGSILSETMESERIENTMTPLRNLFGAIFFVSVGMLVSPHVLFHHWAAIFAITFVVVFGQMVFGTLSFIVSGSTLRDAVQSGFSLVQIGEFAFIIAALGEDLGVTSSFLYPVVVAVSIITTFLTPYSIKLAMPFYNVLQRYLPSSFQEKQSTGRQRKKKTSQQLTLSMAWRAFLSDIVIQTATYYALAVAIGSFCVSFLRPLCNYLLGGRWGSVMCAVLLLVLLSPCIRPIIVRRNNNKNGLFIKSHDIVQSTLYYVVLIVKFCIGTYITFYVIHFFSSMNVGVDLLLGIVASVAIRCSRIVKFVSIRVERIFTQNLTFKDIRKASTSPRYGRRLRGRDIRITTLTVPLHSIWSGKSLSRLHFGRTHEIHVVAIIRAGQRINIPGPSNNIYAGDVLEIAGNEVATEAFRQMMMADVMTSEQLTQQESQLSIASFTLLSTSLFTGKTLIELNMRARYNCLVLGVEDVAGNLRKTQPNRPFQEGDTLWIVAEQADLSLIAMCV